MPELQALSDNEHLEQVHAVKLLGSVQEDHHEAFL